MNPEPARARTIVRVIGRLNIGGPAHQAVLLSHSLRNGPWDTVLVTGGLEPGEGDASFLLDRYPCRVVRLPELRRPVHPLRDAAACWKLLRLLLREKPEILHTHTAKAGTIGRCAGIAYRLISGRKLKLVHTFHGHVFDGYFGRAATAFFLAVERLLARGTDRLVAVSDAVKEDLLARGIGRPAQIRVVRLGLHLDPLAGVEPPPARTPVRIGIVGRIVPVKNHRMFLEALALLGDRPVEAFVIGDGELRAQAEETCRDLGLGARVRFTGWQTDLPVLYAPLDIVCLTSLNEGTPVSLIEALAAGRPVVATDVGGVRDLLGPAEPDGPDGIRLYRHGILVRSGDHRGLAKALRYLADRPELRFRMGKEGKSFAHSKFAFQRLAADVTTLYEGLACEPSS